MNTLFAAAAVPKGSMPQNEPLSAPPVGTKPNYTGNIQDGSFETTPPVIDQQTGQEVSTSGNAPDAKHSFPWVWVLLAALVVVIAIAIWRKSAAKTLTETAV